MTDEDNSTSIDELKQLRSSTKGNISRIKNIVETKGNALSSTELECRLGIVESYFKQLLVYQTQLERLVPGEKCRGDLEDLYISTKTKILSLLGTTRRVSVAETTFSVPHSINHLPKLRLPRFNGKYSEYKNFINSFTTLVDSDPSLTRIEKFNHLLTCLSDQALGTVKAFQVTEENYPKAIARLKERYDNDCLIFLEYISELFDLPKVPKLSASSLRSLVDNISALYNSLQSIGSFEEICNAIVIYIAMSKVDTETQSKWDEYLDYKTLPKWTECAALLSKRCQYLEARDSKHLRSDSAQKWSSNKPSHSQRSQTSLSVTQRCCAFCRDSSHSVPSCSSFIALSIKDRFTNVKRLGLCLNCLGKGHSVAKCPSTYRCKSCRQPHHSLLHRSQPNETNGRSGGSSSDSASRSEEPSTSAAVNAALERERGPTTQVILATALVLVKDSSGSFHIGRILLDSGSQVNLINEKFANILHLKKEKKNIDIVGIGSTETKIHSQTQTTIRSRYNNFELSLELLITPSITGYQPEASLNVTDWNIPRNLELADEHFNQPSQIDLLLGAEAFFDLMQIGQVKLGKGLPTLQKTSLGWIVSGRYKTVIEKDKQVCFVSSMEDNLQKYVEKFWQLEEVQGRKSTWTEEQTNCETLFRQNTEQLPSGRLMVQLPFKRDPDCLGVSYDIAFRRFLSLERRLARNQELKSQYISFLKEYQLLGHMTLVKEPNLDTPHYYMPHQCVVRPESTSTKLRVVFDASCRTSSQISLNGILMVGPTIQDNLFDILIRFRLHRYALTADIVKMYRQILIHPSHRRFQFILWREDESKPVQTYQLNTVTYGTSSAPYLAIRSLLYLSEQNRDRFELGSRVLKADFYVDDMLTGDDDLNVVMQIQWEISAILKSAGMELSKWNSNNADIVQTAIGNQSKEISINDGNLTSTLGIAWNPVCDEFNFSYKPSRMYSKYTKRTILSLSSSLFDPMGLLSPVIIRAKIILQKIWIEKLDWDTSIPQSIETEWRQFMDDLNSLQNVAVPRHALIANTQSYEVHGYADASMQAYGCCLYLRATDSSGVIRTKLLVAKSKVAPARKRQLPHLELCAAHLLSKLWAKIKSIFGSALSKVYFWTDAAIVLHWISTHSSKLGTFVGNRVAEIQEETQGVIWRHVPTQENPADIVSRGCTVDELKRSMWFQGPEYLLQQEENWPSTIEIPLSPEERALEKRKIVLTCAQSEPNILLKIIEGCSSYTKGIRTVAYVLRFCNRVKKQASYSDTILTPAEFDGALLNIVHFIQTNSFAEEIEAIRSRRNIKGSIKWLNPFIQETNGRPLLRVGGRLKHANIPEECKHPLLLPRNHHFTTILVRHLHQTNYHAGAKALVALVRQRFWIINVREIARQVVRNCIHCVRYRPKLLEQVMGNLPQERLTPSRPFLVCGVDFCGPISTYLKIRGKVPYKTYVAVFVCFSSKAVHLEVVSDLSAEAFIAALKRMIGRRGLPSDIHCDNATNFVGAQSKLLELRNMLMKKSSKELVSNFCTNTNINFHFIPPRAPHFGGIWEAAVKVAKGHLYRSLSGAKLTFEELSTALVEIEAVMNSRPITSMSSDPNDFEALTPAHLLIGSSLKAIPEPAVEAADISFIQRWRRINAVKTHFWQRWSAEYIHELQGRSKWLAPSPNINPGSLVIIHDDNLPPQKWQMGRIANVIQGQDGKVRVADVKTPRGCIRRPIRKLAALPC